MTWIKINSKPLQLIMEGIRYQRVWKLERSLDFWNRIVNIHYDLKQWIESFRMSKTSILQLCDQLRDELEPLPNFLQPREPISVEKQVAIALYKLASTAEYRVVGNVMGIHKSSVKKCLYRVVKAINKVMLRQYIHMPDEIEARFISDKFEEKCFIPQIIGSIDGTHVEVIPPKEGYRDFINRKGWPSYNMLAVVDYNGRLFSRIFRNIVVKHPGSCHDAAVLKDSILYQNADTIIPQSTRTINGLEIPFMIVGDPAYPLLPWLLKGFSGSLSAEEESFNVYLNSARVSVEMAFGRLKARWRILHKINCDYKFAPEIISACCILHNYVESKGYIFLTQWLRELEVSELATPQPNTQTNVEKNSIEGTNIRNHIKQFLSENFPLRKALIQP
ncbi:PREDICTED: putative nuclease HARBI1 [Vollenhovia emeryi]|uniref:putative nuclease HARBI1 n=1 Tax=Vollenhovia emeryi TaxID=411798 RepID=UPI0005F57AB0|nr:PREDICTED: putative nuclease HARBI1 [Vollenhovia emeryi]